MQICANKTMRRMARRVLLGGFVMLFSLSANAQKAVNDSIFKGHIYNAEYQVWIDMDFYNSTVMVPRWQIFGAVPGYLGAVRDTRKWVFTSAEIKGHKANLAITNDYGSEDLTATLSYNGDGSYTFTQQDGSTIKIVVNRKWLKLPKKLIFKKQ